MEAPPAEVTALALRRGLGPLVVTHHPRATAGGWFLAAALLLPPAAGLWADGRRTTALLTVLLAVAAAGIGALRRRNVRRGLPVLYGFQDGMVLRRADGRQDAYPWSQVDTEQGVHTGAVQPWGRAAPGLLLRSKDGERLATVRDPAARERLAELTAG